jgi:predicted nucleic acid-binding protein
VVLDRLKAGDYAIVPAFWSVEVFNWLLVGERRGRISPEQTQAFLRSIQALCPTFDNAALDRVVGPVQKLCPDHGLTPYDALYVDLAMSKKCPLATLDQPQRDAAEALGIQCL